MNNYAIIELVDIFYSFAINLSNKLGGKTIYYFKSNIGYNIWLLDANKTIRANVALFKTNEYKGRNIENTAYEIEGLVSISPADTLIIIAACWKIFGPIVPDSNSVSGSAFQFIQSYFNRYKNDPNLIKPAFSDEYATPLRAIYFPNEYFVNMINNLEIIFVENESEIHSLMKETDDLFEDLYTTHPLNVDNGNKEEIKFREIDALEDITEENTNL